MSGTFSAEALRSLFEAVAQGGVSPDQAVEKLKHFDVELLDDYARIDNHRALRTGFPEVIWGPGKTPQQIIGIMNAMRSRHPVVMATRIEPTVAAEIQAAIPDVDYFDLPRLCVLGDRAQVTPQPGNLSIVSAGTADLSVAEEAAMTAELSGFQVTRLWDVGVAGIHRLLNNQHVIHAADVIIVVAGMEGALASVVAGLADCPVIAVPTSVGYGTHLNGIAALLTMLNSCATGIGVMNIDNGFGAAVLAGQILRTGARIHPAGSSSDR